MGRFTNFPSLTISTDGRTATVIQGFRYDLGRKNSGNVVYIEPGMKTDGLTLPYPISFIRPLAPRWANLKAILVHDKLCYDRYYIKLATKERMPIDQKQIDLEFYFALRALKMPKWRAKIYYIAVRFYQTIIKRRP